MIEGLDIQKSYGEKQVIAGLTLRFAEGRIYCLTGPSGCGKTTLLHILGGLVRPDAGRVQGLEGKRLSFVFQEDRLLPWASALENAGLAGGDAAGWLERLGLGGEKDALPGELSGGMQRRVAIARALAHDGDVFILDEPFKGLDGATKERAMGVLLEAARGKTVFLVTHDVQEAAWLGGETLRFQGVPLCLA